MNETENMPTKYKVYTYVSKETYKAMFKAADTRKMSASDFISACIESGIKSTVTQDYDGFKRVSDVGDLPF